jgi:phosphoglycerol transferase MdoB-like AlkP superfamily enzyme
MKIKKSVLNRRFILISTFFLSLITIGWNLMLHFVILENSTKSIWGILRKDLTDTIWISILLLIVIVLCFTLSFLKWRKKGTLTESLKHSLFFSVLIIFAVYVNEYILYDIPFIMILKWSLSSLIEYTLYGFLLKFFYNTLSKIENLK